VWVCVCVCLFVTVELLYVRMGHRLKICDEKCKLGYFRQPFFGAIKFGSSTVLLFGLLFKVGRQC